ncbi:SWIM zinc finger family protein [Crossiella sp. NPDC003009]
MRADLLGLTPDALAAVANRGLVKRAAKELDTGPPPEVTADEAGAVTVRFADGTVTGLPAGVDLTAASCTCAASGVCRHRIGLVLAYQREFGAATPPPWSPGTFTDDQLAAQLGARAITAARRAHQRGYTVRLRRGTSADPVARADLPTGTVAFLAPGDLGYARADGAAGDEQVVLAVWAFREAEQRALTGAEVRFEAGGPGEPAATTSGVAGAVALTEQLVLDGVRHTSPAFTAALRRTADELGAAGLHWPAAAMADLVEQLDAYATRGAGYQATRLAELVTEIHVRHRATGPRAAVLGSEQAAGTPLRRVRLTSLGCRIRSTPTAPVAEVFLAEPGSGTVLVARQSWPTGPEPITGAELAGRRFAGSTLGALATANVVSESAARDARGLVRFGAHRARTTVSPLGNAWASLPAPVLVADLGALGTELGELPPRLVRPRFEAEHMRVVPIAGVSALSYHPGDQRLDAVITDPGGATATIARTHHPLCPAALDCLAEALSGAHGRPRFVSGTVRRHRGGLVLDPLAVLTDHGIFVPDLATGPGPAIPTVTPGQPPDQLGLALSAATEVTAQAIHHGLRDPAPATHTALAAAVTALSGAGLHTAAADLSAFGAALRGEDRRLAVDTWVRAQFRLLTTAEFR